MAQYYSIPSPGNSFVNWLQVNEIPILIGLAVLMLISIICFLVYSVHANTDNKTIIHRIWLSAICSITFACLLGISIIVPVIYNRTNFTYYTSSPQVTHWVDNTVYLKSSGDFTTQDKFKLITRTPTKIEANTPTGAAYLRVVNYVKEHSNQITNVSINVNMNRTIANFETVSEHKRVISFADNSKNKNAYNTKARKEFAEWANSKGFSKDQINTIFESNTEELGTKVLAWK